MNQNSNLCDPQKSDEGRGTKQNGRWTRQEHLKFLDGLKVFGKDWKRIESVVKTRTGSQIRSHAQKFFNKLDRKYENERYTRNQENSESYVDNFEEKNSGDLERQLYLRQKYRKKARKIHSSCFDPASPEVKLEQSHQDRTAETHKECYQQPSTAAATQPRPFQQPSYPFGCQVYPDIWRIPLQLLLRVNFYETFVDMGGINEPIQGIRGIGQTRRQGFRPWVQQGNGEGMRAGAIGIEAVGRARGN